MSTPNDENTRVETPGAIDDDDQGLRERAAELQERLQQSWPGKFAQRFFDYDILALAAALSFYTLLSLAPLVLMLLWLTTTLYPTAQDEFFRQIGLLVGPQVEETARLIVANAEQESGTGSMAALLGAGALLVGASIVFGQLQTALNRVFRSDATRLGGVLAWLRKRLLSFGMAIAVGFLLVVSMAVQAALAMLMAWLPDLLPVFATAFSFLLYSAVFMAMYLRLAFKADSPVENPEKLYRERALMVVLVVCAVVMTVLLLVDLPFLDDWFSPTVHAAVVV